MPQSHGTLPKSPPNPRESPQNARNSQGRRQQGQRLLGGTRRGRRGRAGRALRTKPLRTVMMVTSRARRWITCLTAPGGTGGILQVLDGI